MFCRIQYCSFTLHAALIHIPPLLSISSEAGRFQSVVLNKGGFHPGVLADGLPPSKDSGALRTMHISNTLGNSSNSTRLSALRVSRRSASVLLLNYKCWCVPVMGCYRGCSSAQQDRAHMRRDLKKLAIERMAKGYSTYHVIVG